MLEPENVSPVLIRRPHSPNKILLWPALLHFSSLRWHSQGGRRETRQHVLYLMSSSAPHLKGDKTGLSCSLLTGCQLHTQKSSHQEQLENQEHKSWGLKSCSCYRAECHVHYPLWEKRWNTFMDRIQPLESAHEKPLAKPLKQEINKKQELERFCAQKYSNLQGLLAGNKMAESFLCSMPHLTEAEEISWDKALFHHR